MGERIASLYAEIGADTTKIKGALNGLKSDLVDTKDNLKAADMAADSMGDSIIKNSEKSAGALGELKRMAGTAGVLGAVMKLGGFVRDSVNDWSEYAESIEKAAANAGVSTEEMSRLTQAADDFRVSQAGLEMAMRMALQNGVVPSIENLAELSDQYLAIQDPAERAEFLSVRFGRSWEEIAPMMQKGGDAIRGATKEISDNLIVTEEAMRKNKEYIKVLDDYQDAWTGIKNEVSMGVMPALTDLMNFLSSGDAADAADFINEVFKGTFLETEPSKEFRRAEDAARAYTYRLEEQAEAWRELHPEIVAGEDALESAADAARNAKEDLLGLNDVDLNFSGSIKRELDKIAFYLAGGLDLQQVTDDIKAAMDAGHITEEQAQDMFAEAYIAAQGLEVKMGDITADKAAKNINDTLGLSLTDAKNKVKEVVDEFDNIPRELHTRLYIEEYHTMNVAGAGTTGGGGGGSDEVMHASGGSFIIPPGYTETFPVGPGHVASAGEKVTITPVGKTADEKKAAVIIYANVENQVDIEQLAYEVIRRMKHM